MRGQPTSASGPRDRPHISPPLARLRLAESFNSRIETRGASSGVAGGYGGARRRVAPPPGLILFLGDLRARPRPWTLLSLSPSAFTRRRETHDTSTECDASARVRR
ncbi:hypothetical protein J6590_027705 [Homalodisca vitripennis]|nr:hypothetical protein J6590_027705 [Homalodisca vitripennis]